MDDLFSIVFDKRGRSASGSDSKHHQKWNLLCLLEEASALSWGNAGFVPVISIGVDT